MNDLQPRVFLVASSSSDAKDNFERTVLNRVNTDRLESFSNLPFSSEQLPVWGTKAGNKNYWEKIREGDYLFFYQDQHYPYAARVLGTEKNEEIGRDLWPNFSGEDPWKYIIYLLDILETDFSNDEINAFAGYADNFVPQGFMTYSDDGVSAIEEQYGTIWDFVTRGRDRRGQTEPSDIDIYATPYVTFETDILDGLYFPNDRDEEILDQVATALNAGKHVVFTGPPGTGKTEIARRVSAELADTHPGVYSGHEMTTATADWSTFETVGGYMPAEGQTDDEGLGFEPGQVLLRFKQDETQCNELLVIDEINRADIDKAFGQLFTLLSGQRVQLPYKRNGKEIEVVPADVLTGDGTELAPHRYVKPESWRIFATMNSYDKTSLYEMSYAFMRRFSFIHVDAPTVPEAGEKRDALVRNYADAWDIEPRDQVIEAIGELWRKTNDGADVRKLGPAIVEDVLRHVESAPPGEINRAMTQALASYVFPQLEGVPDRRQLVSLMAETEHVDRDRLWELASDVLDVSRNA